MLTIVAKFFILDVCASSSKDLEYDFQQDIMSSSSETALSMCSQICFKT